MQRTAPTPWKYANELRYWLKVKRREGTLSNDHYLHFFTESFGLKREDFDGCDLLDVGCGPRGSLEWATEARSRYGVDPLARFYSWLSPHHQMTYVPSRAESMPFPDENFDFVSSFNSLDHVSDVPAVLLEMRRVLRPGGRLLLITDFGHERTACEPQAFGLEILDLLKRHFVIEDLRLYRRDPEGIYASVKNGAPYAQNHDSTGVLCARMRRTSG